MATLSATNIQVFGHTTSTGPIYDSSGKAVWNCFLTCEFSGTYVQADNAKIAAVPTAIANSLTSGETIALLDAAFSSPGLEDDTVIGAKTVAVSSADITLELTGADLSTEHAGAALNTITRPLCFYVTYTRIAS